MNRLAKKILKFISGYFSESFVRKLSYFLIKLRGGYFSLNKLDKQLEQYVNFDNGFFVELGANDGIQQSNSLYFEMKRNWRGVLVEPTPHNFLLCKKQRSIENNFFCNACVSFDYKDKYVDIRYANLMSISENLDLDLEDKEEHLLSGKKHLSSYEDIFSFGAVAATLTSILEKSNAPKVIDFLSLDVEGAELEVLKGIDFNKYSFKYMLVEVTDLNKIENFLNHHGYILEKQMSVHDYLFKNTN